MMWLAFVAISSSWYCPNKLRDLSYRWTEIMNVLGMCSLIRMRMRLGQLCTHSSFFHSHQLGQAVQNRLASCDLLFLRWFSYLLGKTNCPFHSYLFVSLIYHHLKHDTLIKSESQIHLCYLSGTKLVARIWMKIVI